MVVASSNPGDLVLDFFAGSGTTGEACQQTGRRFVLIDENPEALQVMAKRFAQLADIDWVGFDPKPYQSIP
jgi:site-specific DNA-methyltransferase (adenine-specific)